MVPAAGEPCSQTRAPRVRSGNCSLDSLVGGRRMRSASRRQARFGRYDISDLLLAGYPGSGGGDG